MTTLREALERGCTGRTRQLIKCQLPLVQDYVEMDRWATDAVQDALVRRDLRSAAFVARLFLLATLEGPIRWILLVIGRKEKLETMGNLEGVLEDSNNCPPQIRNVLTGASLRERLLATHEDIFSHLGALSPIQKDAAEAVRAAVEQMSDVKWRQLRNALAHFQVKAQADGTIIWLSPDGKENGRLPVEALLLYIADLRTLAFEGLYELADIMSTPETTSGV